MRVGAVVIVTVLVSCGGVAPPPVPPVAASGCAVPEVACGGRCVNDRTDTTNCGRCGGTCLEGQACNDGRCQCRRGLESCTTGCMDLSTDIANCGACGNACAEGHGCRDGRCTCAQGDAAFCGGACVELLTDVDHCGSCGRSCGAGGRCTAGHCAVRLATATGFGRMIAHAGTLYARLGNGIVSLGMQPGSMRPLTTAKVGEPVALAADATSIYWVNTIATTLERTSIATGVTTLVSTKLDMPLDVAVGRSEIYVISQGPYVSYELFSLPVRGGAPTKLVVSQDRMRSLALVDDRVFWSQGLFRDGGIRMLANGAITAVTADIAWGLAVEDRTAFFVSHDSVFRASIFGGPATELTPPSMRGATIRRAGPVALTPGWVYYRVPLEKLARVPIGGGPEEVIADGQSVVDFASDGTNLFWTTVDGVWRFDP